MRFLLGKSDFISERSFTRIKWLLSAVSVVLSLGLVVLLETHL